MQKGSKQWYDEMAKKLNYHVTGMRSIRRVPQMKKSIAVSEMVMLMTKHFGKPNKELEDISKEMIGLLNKQLERIIKIKTLYLTT